MPQAEKIDIERVKARRKISDVVAAKVKPRKAGTEFVGLCPFHNEKTPSFRVNDGKGVWHCFGCGKGGDVIEFVQLADFDAPDILDPELLAMLAQWIEAEHGDTGTKAARP